MDSKRKIYPVKFQSSTFQKKYHERILAKCDDMLLFRNKELNIAVLDKVGEGGPLPLGNFILTAGTRVVDFVGYLIKQKPFVTAVVNDGWVTVCKINNSASDFSS